MGSKQYGQPQDFLQVARTASNRLGRTHHLRVAFPLSGKTSEAKSIPKVACVVDYRGVSGNAVTVAGNLAGCPYCFELSWQDASSSCSLPSFGKDERSEVNPEGCVCIRLPGCVRKCCNCYRQSCRLPVLHSTVRDGIFHLWIAAPCREWSQSSSSFRRRSISLVSHSVFLISSSAVGTVSCVFFVLALAPTVRAVLGDRNGRTFAFPSVVRGRCRGCCRYSSFFVVF